ncbi:hypothetical protein [Ulvibacterium sp.]|uniref:hypothetical protein n=1 Tax=Ulvibacterium sp. TaxID=2665914 RepID=UPI002627B287|nr:hypothetical protein [Ulvibacterium sp.]
MRTVFILCFIIVFAFPSCSNDATTLEERLAEDNMIQEDGQEPEQPGSDCPSSVGFVFEEKDGIISIEFEDNSFPEGWVLKNDANDVSGDGYMQWEGDPSMGNPGNGMISFPVRISDTGTYRFTWNSSYRKGDNGTEHNDSWLRFPDAQDFFGMKDGGSRVYPDGSGKEPNPNGASKDGWFKVYRSGDDNAFKWQARTSDHDAHDIYVTFETPGVYLMEIAARSDFHAIDRILLHKESISENEALSQADNFSIKETCN